MRKLHTNSPVQSDQARRPLAVLRHGRFVQVTAVLDSWQWAGDWVSGVSERNYWLVTTEEGSALELYEETESGQWVVSGVQD
jgi:hypothetical protein